MNKYSTINKLLNTWAWLMLCFNKKSLQIILISISLIYIWNKRQTTGMIMKEKAIRRINENVEGLFRFMRKNVSFSEQKIIWILFTRITDKKLPLICPTGRLFTRSGSPAKPNVPLNDEGKAYAIAKRSTDGPRSSS